MRGTKYAFQLVLWLALTNCTPLTATSSGPGPRPEAPSPAQAPIEVGVASSPPTSPTSPPASPSALPEPRPTMKPETQRALSAPSIPFKTLATDDWKSYANSRDVFAVLKQREDANRLMQDPDLLQYSPAQSLLTLDFATHMAIFVCDRLYPCVYETEIVSIEETAETLIVHAITWSPLGEGCFTAMSQPFCLVSLPKTNKPVRFEPIIFEDKVFRPSPRPSPSPTS